MTRREVAEALGVSERTVGSYAQSGRLDVRYLPGKTSPVANFDPEQVAGLRRELAPVAKVEAPKAEVGTLKLETKMPKLEDEHALAVQSSNFVVPSSNFDSANFVAIEASHLPMLAQALVGALEASRVAAPSELAAKIGITVPEACVLTGLSEKAMRSAIKNGEIPARRIGRSTRLRPGDVRAWFDRQFAQDENTA